ncbi:MAG TPA: acyl-CoA dehydrogenase family protein, partial [Pyrinomonadaceae bacterium]|nr:acyl-CoA dehydrogenase family protein [Pyrinomonadaceae bacterium]
MSSTTDDHHGPDKFFEETPFFSDGHQRLAVSVRDFAAREIAPRAGEEADVDAQFRDLLSLLAQADLLRYAVGSNADEFDARALCLIREALAYYSSLADLAFVMQGLGTYAISLAAPEHVKNFWLARASEGKSIAAFALTEPEAGSDVGAISTTAERDGESSVINGRKRFISNAGIADFYTV